MSDTFHGPMNRGYSTAEIAAARRVDVAYTDKRMVEGFRVVSQLGGPLVYATGPHWPGHARKMANDWTLVADAMEREWGT